jgi:hypothetical protein
MDQCSAARLFEHFSVGNDSLFSLLFFELFDSEDKLGVCDRERVLLTLESEASEDCEGHNVIWYVFGGFDWIC